LGLHCIGQSYHFSEMNAEPIWALHFTSNLFTMMRVTVKVKPCLTISTFLAPRGTTASEEPLSGLRPCQVILVWEGLAYTDRVAGPGREYLFLWGWWLHPQFGGSGKFSPRREDLSCVFWMDNGVSGREKCFWKYTGGQRNQPGKVRELCSWEWLKHSVLNPKACLTISR
jgi:hypothetical protein